MTPTKRELATQAPVSVGTLNTRLFQARCRANTGMAHVQARMLLATETSSPSFLRSAWECLGDVLHPKIWRQGKRCRPVPFIGEIILGVLMRNAER